jgi:hypothetical protein
LGSDWVTSAVVTRPIKRLLKKELAAVKELADAHSIHVGGWTAPVLATTRVSNH